MLIPSTASAAAAAPAPDCLTQAPPACYTPRAFLTAYGVWPLLERGIDGRGTTAVLIEEAHQGPPQPVELTDIRQDLVLSRPAALRSQMPSQARSASPATGSQPRRDCRAWMAGDEGD